MKKLLENKCIRVILFVTIPLWAIPAMVIALLCLLWQAFSLLLDSILNDLKEP